MCSRIFLIAAMLFALAGERPSFAAGGCSSGSCGGNFSATEFKDLARDAIDALRSIRKRGPLVVKEIENTNGAEARIVDLEIDPEILRQAYRTVSVVNQELHVGGKLVNFKSQPGVGHVDFTEEDWRRHATRKERLRMVIHELLMLSIEKNAEYNDYNYDEQLARRLTNYVLREEERGVFLTAVKAPAAEGDCDSNAAPKPSDPQAKNLKSIEDVIVRLPAAEANAVARAAPSVIPRSRRPAGRGCDLKCQVRRDPFFGAAIHGLRPR